jgi:4-hydroxy-4-methyl-2-oxoglutarate aldolase
VTGQVNAAADPFVSKFAALGTSTVSDALDRLGIAGQAWGVRPLDRSFRLCGRAFTGMYQPVDVGGGTVGDYIDDVAPGAIVVLDNSGRCDATVWGDILTTAASQRGIGGTVINGVCRDSDRSLSLAYPVYSIGVWMRTGKDRVQLVATNVPVVLGRVRVRPEDLIVGDGDGVVVIPSGREEEVLSAAVAIEAAENAIRAQVQRGVRLDAARHALGYHQLQSRADSP